jgi:hypothetical protein
MALESLAKALERRAPVQFDLGLQLPNAGNALQIPPDLEGFAAGYFAG